MTEFFKKNDSVRARPDYLADSINPLPLGKSDMRRNRPSCNGVPNKQMLRTRHHVFEHRNLLPHASRVIETFPQLAPALFGLLEGALRKRVCFSMRIGRRSCASLKLRSGVVPLTGPLRLRIRKSRMPCAVNSELQRSISPSAGWSIMGRWRCYPRRRCTEREDRWVHGTGMECS